MATGTKRSLLEVKKQLESVYPIKASMVGASSTKSIKALNRRICWGETGILYQHDPRHVDVLVESLGLESGHTVQIPILDNVIDENPAWFLSQDRADRTFAVNELWQMSDPSQHSFSKLKRLDRYLQGETVDPGFRIRGHEFRSDGVLRLRLGWRQRNAEVVKCGGRPL